MLPSLGHIIIAIISACLAIGLLTILNDRLKKEGKKIANPAIQIVIIIAIIIFFLGYLMS